MIAPPPPRASGSATRMSPGLRTTAPAVVADKRKTVEASVIQPRDHHVPIHRDRLIGDPKPTSHPDADSHGQGDASTARKEGLPRECKKIKKAGRFVGSRSRARRRKACLHLSGQVGLGGRFRSFGRLWDSRLVLPGKHREGGGEVHGGSGPAEAPPLTQVQMELDKSSARYILGP